MAIGKRSWKIIARQLLDKQSLHIDDEGTGPFALVAPCEGEVAFLSGQHGKHRAVQEGAPR